MAEMFGGVCPQDFVPALHAIQADQIHLRINCPGGDVFAAEAMCQAIRENGAKVTAHIEGLAASAATAIACACDEVLATPASKYMIHETWTMALGNKRELRSMADVLDKADQSLIDAYARRTGNTPDQLQAWIEAETWFTAEEARRYGFVDTVKPADGGAKASAHGWRLGAYKNAATQATETTAVEQTDEPVDPSIAARHQRFERMRAVPIV